MYHPVALLSQNKTVPHLLSNPVRLAAGALELRLHDIALAKVEYYPYRLAAKDAQATNKSGFRQLNHKDASTGIYVLRCVHPTESHICWWLSAQINTFWRIVFFAILEFVVGSSTNRCVIQADEQSGVSHFCCSRYSGVNGMLSTTQEQHSADIW